MRLTLASFKSYQLIMVSKLCIVLGALLVIVGIVDQFDTQLSSAHPGLLLDLPGFILFVLGLYVRKKALAIRRKFEWRENYKTIQY